MTEERDEILEHYFAEHGDDGGSDGGDVTSWILDPIPPELVGGVDVARLIRWARRLPANAVLRLGILLLDPTVAWPEREEEEESPPPKPPRVQVHEWLCGQTEELVRIRLLRPAAKTEALRCRCGLFPVRKKVVEGKTLMRLIFDARPGNRLLEATRGRVRLFTLGELQALIASRAFVFILDYRHWYYQLPLPHARQSFFAVHMPGVGIFVPTVVPMGWADACLVGQCISLAIVTWREPGESSLGLEEVTVAETMPTVLHAAERGKRDTAILVLMDGIAVFSTTERRRGSWQRRIERNSALFRAVVKETQVANGGRGDVAVFAGLEFIPGKAWRPSAKGDLQSGPRTLRACQSLVGSLLWWLRVWDRNLCADHPDLLDLCGRLQRAQDGVPPSSTVLHSQQLPTNKGGELSLTAEELAVLGRLVEERRRSIELGVWCEPAPKVGITSVRFFASDACRVRMGWVHYGKLTEGPESVIVGEELPEDSQVAREAEALAIGAEREAAAALKRGEDPRGVAVLVALDADGVRYGAEKLHFRRPGLRHIVQRLRATQLRLAYVRVPSGDMVADGPSRGRAGPDEDGDFERRDVATRRLLRLRLAELDW